ncbi:flavonol synthase/flavanone 3-hydroxylase-like [Hibiscus syriacus]|uniref:Flavonol synthase/flavanone 3-hydroxylase-like n=1 Tax=Hibiscus syriacus TaxID=106335 RepID=A0A6A2WK93_HIBSY|nr:flavonol synthase/flavanone 3-hydroxylase-like [Hibiscus syriacus]
MGGELLSDVGEEFGEALEHHLRHDATLPPQSFPDSIDASYQFLDLIKLFQENFEKLKVALDDSDHSWTTLTLELCTALKTANKLAQSTDTNV